ncbi:MAG TPA: aminotransferase class I/II-fold pyridoxal phosphate-dependent enzyme [Thermoplasmataceae archaeon]|nr:aminotransferase class I/II-fold pyridoxal phosphate-dependent enzyme [Thermoplasmatales archaeon AK]HLH85836.1 aminotransferase class I/II-fold pyridoxal phosphate-dependent enzyme [Thermoplasmataceae archaeon]
MRGRKFQDIELIRWIVEKSPVSKHNLSLSGLPEPDFSEMGVEIKPEDQFQVNRNAQDMFLQTLEDVYGFPRENVLLTTGGSEAIFLLSLLAWKRGLKVAVRTPEYQPIFRVPENLGVPVRLVGNWDELDRLLASGSAAFLSNPNNPVGTFLLPGQIEELVSRIKGDAFVYVDEAFLEFKFQKKPESVFFEDDRLVVNGSMTKFYGFSNYRVGWIASSKKNIHDLSILRTSTGISNPAYPLWIAYQALLNRSRFQERALKIIPATRQTLKDFVETEPGLSWEYPSASSYALVHYDLPDPSEELCRKILDSTGVLLGPGSYFGSEKSFRVCITPEPEKFREALESLKSYLSEFRKS